MMSLFWWTMCNNRKGETTAVYLQSPLRHCCAWDEIQRKNVLIKKIMRQELLQSFEEEDMALFVEKACSTSRKEDPEILYEWHCPVYCHCRMPDDGNEMVQCIACKCWFHGKCETGNFNNSQWRCKPCQDVFEMEQKRESERKKKKRRQRAATTKCRIEIPSRK